MSWSETVTRVALECTEGCRGQKGTCGREWTLDGEDRSQQQPVWRAGSLGNMDSAWMLAQGQESPSPFEALTLHGPLSHLKCNPSEKGALDGTEETQK